MVAPICISGLGCLLYQAVKILRMSCMLLMSCKCKTLGTRSFGYAGPTLWNGLPLEIRSAKDINCFKSLMKTHSFGLAYNL